MSKPDIQRFDRDGIWRKPAGAVRVDVTLKGGDSGGEATAHAYVGHRGGGRGGSSGGGYLAASSSVSVSGYTDVRGLGKTVPATEAETVTESFAADDLPDEVHIEVGKGGRPGGRDGYALIITHLTGGTDG
jgi:hypothetical protein